MRRFTSIFFWSVVLVHCGQDPRANSTASLTGEGFAGKKHYLGFGEYLSGFMGNETRYDVQHTNDIFSTGAGGNYKSRTLVNKPVNASTIKSAWADIRAEMGSEDLFVQYSSGHGYQQGLGVGVTYNEIRDNALSYGAKETVIFIMACHSGGLVAAFKEKEAQWKDFAQSGRSLFVMASSRLEETSSTGPGKDDDEPNGPNGSAGSAFGHALWKALIGNADGILDGVKDGYLSLGEIEAFTKAKTKEIGGHNPVTTGTYDPFLIMNRVPSRAQFALVAPEESYDEMQTSISAE